MRQVGKQQGWLWRDPCLQRHVLMRDEKEGRKKEASKVKQTNKAKQHSTPKEVTFPKTNELPRVGLEPTILYTLDRALYHMYTLIDRQKVQGSSSVSFNHCLLLHYVLCLLLSRLYMTVYLPHRAGLKQLRG